ncbi:uncharacterized protein LOC105789564 [Gossypium raimondii]|uniref:uncharacterized protein LOC105789564 n=1 Tax=Gossypium raimondii TaxID=29730 RepID=UPI00063AB4A5|nr:uncharacterized protein LOC105789564 [Gossypium raimondii]
MTEKESNRICWQPPPKKRCKLNIDGAKHLQTGRTSAGGLLRNHKGEWIIGTLAIRDGSDIALRRGIQQLLVESDNLVAANTICGQSKEVGSNSVQIIKEQLARDWHIKVSYTPRSANMIADSLAKLSKNDPVGLKIYEYPLNQIFRGVLQESISDCYKFNHG